MGIGIVTILHLILVYQYFDTGFADSTFSPVINNNNNNNAPPSTQSTQTANSNVQGNVASQQVPSSIFLNEPQKTSTTRPTSSTETIRIVPFKPAASSITDQISRVPATRFLPAHSETSTQFSTTAGQVSTTEIGLITSTTLATTTPSSMTTSVPLSTSETSTSTQSFSPTKAQTESPNRFAPSRTTTRSPIDASQISIVTIVPTNNTANNNTLTIVPTNRTTFPRPSTPGPHIQTLVPVRNRLRDTRCFNDSDCNAGLCRNSKCFCPLGFSGLKCQIAIDPCVSNPCFNNATCREKGGEFECDCPPGYKGEHCESEINMCQDDPCANNGTCINYISRYECQCQSGFKGDKCEINVDDCYSKPCLNNGTCIDGIDKYTCDCASTGYTGDHCETNIDDCESKPCLATARRCIDLINGFKCDCHDGFTGTHCEIDIKECEKNPCLNGGTCIEKSHSLHNRYDSIQSNFNYSQYAGHKCECLEDYQGVNCEEKKKCRAHIDLCTKSSAVCLDNIDGSYDCQINASFDGTDQHYAEYSLVKDYKKFQLEEIKVKYRSVKGGVILSFVTSQTFMELQLNETGLYLNGSSIELSNNTEDLLDGREHEFHVGLHLTDIDQIHLARSLSEQSPFKGCLIQVRLNNHFLPFYNYGDEANQIFNITHSNFDPERCLVCFENDCLNNGQCDVYNMEGFSCNCPNTFTGVHCEEDVNECRSSQCIHGHCENIVGGYQCNCESGFSGKACENISDHCLAKRPCLFGTCKSNGSSSYSCECPSSRIGKHCEWERTCSNECNEKNSQCIQNKTCACLPHIDYRTMDNAMCEAITSCDKYEGLLCRNGGTCYNLDGNGYRCLCPEGFVGIVCEHQVPHKPFDVILFVVIACIGLLLATCAVVSLIIFKSVRRARATQGTYSPQTEEIYGERMFADTILKVPPTERLI